MLVFLKTFASTKNDKIPINMRNDNVLKYNSLRIMKLMIHSGCYFIVFFFDVNVFENTNIFKNNQEHIFIELIMIIMI